MWILRWRRSVTVRDQGELEVGESERRASRGVPHDGSLVPQSTPSVHATEGVGFGSSASAKREKAGADERKHYCLKYVQMSKVRTLRSSGGIPSDMVVGATHVGTTTYYITSHEWRSKR